MNQPITPSSLNRVLGTLLKATKSNIILHFVLLAVFVAGMATNAMAQVSQTFTATQSYTVPPGVTQLIVECWGGGGAGGGATGNPACGGGGAGGAYARKLVTVTPGASYTINVGAAKTATVSSNAAANKGNPSWFGSTSTVFADGGNGGAPATANSSNGAGGAGTASTSIGDVVFAGGNGANGNFTSNIAGGAGGGGAGSTQNGSNANAGNGGAGGSLSGGAGANGVANSNAGAIGANYGGGGSGGKANSGTDRSGGTGAQGYVIITIPAPANNECAGAIPLTLNAAAITGNVSYSTNSLAPCAGVEAYDVWYSFTTSCSGNYTLTVDPSNSFDAVFQVYNSCGGSVVSSTTSSTCINAGANNVNETATYSLASQTTYFVRVYDFNATATGYPSTTTFTIGVTSPTLPTVANAGPDQTSALMCGLTSTALAANTPSVGTGSWSIVSGAGGSFLNSSLPTTTFSGVAGTTYTLRWTIASGNCTPSTDDVVIAFNVNPIANAGPDQTGASTCGLTSVTLAGSLNAGTGTWSVVSGSGGSFSNVNSPTATFTGTAGTTYTLRWTVSNPPCLSSASDEVTIRLNANPVLNITNPAAACSNSSVNLTAAAVTAGSTGGGTLSYWTNPAGTNALATPSAVTTGGTYYIRSTTAAGCTDIEPVVVTITQLPVATFSYTGTPYCKNASNPLPTFSGGGVAGTFSSTAGLAFVSAATGQINLTASTSGSYTITNTIAAAGGCPAVIATSPVTITTPPSATIAYTGGPFCTSVASAAVTRTGTAGGTYSAPSGLTINPTTGAITPSTSTPGTYTVTYTVAAAGGCPVFTTTTSVTIVAIPVVTISTNYCNPGAGWVRLTASAGSSYAWSNGATTQSIDVDLAGTYTVNVTNSSGCVGTGFVNVATELVLNGNFESGNTGITSLYTYQPNTFDGSYSSGLYPEGLYSVGSNANAYHNNFFGTDHTTGSGNFMIVNGSGAPIPPVVWQQTVTVQPNTTYYFSAWAMSVNAVPPYAKLRFAVDDIQVGTIATLQAGPTTTAGPFNWVRFYGTWTSGPSQTSAEISILDIETALGGNDFGIDDISFGTLSPVPFTVAPSAGVGGNIICEGSPLTIYANREGGMSPFTYSWTGPNGFTSNQENPFISASTTTAMAGLYSLSVTDAQSCTATGSFTLTVNALPTNLTPTAVPSSICSGSSSNIQIASSQLGVSYQLFANGSAVGTAVNGTGATISLPTGNLTANRTFSVVATNTTTGCSRTLSTTPTVTILPTPVLNITNQAVCSGTVNLTAAGVTAGSTGGGTLTYWTNSACTIALTNPSAVNTSGTYFIRSAVGSCTDVEPVVVTISTTPIATFNYTGSPYCKTATNPLPTFSGGGTAGVFSSSTGVVFVNTSTGEINLAATPAGTHTITNTITPSGACSAVSVSRTVVVTAFPVASFTYPSTTMCQDANATDPAPVYINGGAAGTFSSSFGLSINASNGTIDISASTPGSYAVTNTRAAAGGCPSVSSITYIYINPYTFSGGVVAATSPSTICSGQAINLSSEAPIYLSAVLREDFNSTTNNWSTTNSSTGGTPANAAYTLRPDEFNNDGLTFSSNDATQFYMTSSRAQGSGGTTLTTLRSPAMSTVGYATLALDFFHYFRASNSGDAAKVQVSVDGFNWIDVATYTTTQGSSDGFVNAVIDLNDYIGLSQLFIRFRYDATNDRYWAIDNVSVTGYSENYAYAWSSAPVGFISGLQNPTATPTTNTSYTARAINSYGCSASSSAVAVTVNPSPSLSSSLTPPAICSNTAFTYTPTSATSGVTYSWTRASVSGISNAAITTPQSANPNETLINTTQAPVDVVYAYTTSRNGCSTTQNVTVRVFAPNVWNGSQSTNWFTGLNWCINGNGIPTSTTNALIPSIAVTGRNPIIDNAQGTGAVARNLTILSGGGLTINGSAALTLWGSWNNSGTFVANSSTVSFRGTSADSIVGSGSQQFFNLTLDKGVDTTTVLRAKADINIAGTLALTNGLLSTQSNTLTATTAVNISNKSGIEVAGGTATINNNVTNSGLIRVMSGTANLGSTTAHTLTNNSGSRIRLAAGTLNVGGNLINNGATNRFNGGAANIGGVFASTGTTSLIQSGGTVTINTGAVASNVYNVLDINGATSVAFSGGNMILQNANGGNKDEVFISPGMGTKTFTAAHNLQLGNSSTLSSSTFEIEVGNGIRLGKLTVSDAYALQAELESNTTIQSLQLDNVVLLDGKTLVIDNPSTSAITGNSYIRSETTNGASKIQWNIGNNTGTYTFPFGTALGASIPFEFEITSAGTQLANGNITVATYPTDDNNLPLAPTVLNMVMENGNNGAQSTVDRWWIIDANNYLVKPVSNMTFNYAAADLAGNALITPANLQAQRWDISLNLGLGGWNPPDFFGLNQALNGVNGVKVQNVTNYSPWTLHDSQSPGSAPLPIELLDFNVGCNDNQVAINWTTATETNNSHFTIQRSTDLVNFTDIAVVAGAGESNTPLSYVAYDNSPIAGSVVYYRLMQTDFNGQFEIFSPVAATCVTKDIDVISIYPNPASDVLNIRMDVGADDKGIINVHNSLGQVVRTITVQPYKGQNIYTVDVSDLSYGQYFISFAMDNKNYPVQKLVVTR